MPQISSDIPSMVQGMSQQAPELRLPTHGDYQLNMVSHQTYGLGRRLGTDHVRTLSSVNNPTRMWTSWVSRDGIEKYQIMYDGASLRVLGLEGTEYPVIADPDDLRYLNSATPYKDLMSVGMSDSWMILNRRVTTAASTTTTSAIANSTAVLWIKQGSYGAEYKITVASQTVKFICAPGDVSTLQTSYIAQQLVAMLNANATVTATYTITHTTGNSWFTVARTAASSSEFTITATDSLAGAGIGLVQHEAEAFDALPPTAPADYMCLVLGNPGESADDYWVKYTTTRDGEARGLWTEFPAPGATSSLDASTLPHLLERQVDDVAGTTTGTPNQVYFSFGTATWADRVAGDDTTLPVPGFVGSPIVSAAVFQNRLWFGYKGSVFASRSADFFNPWRTSATQIVDEDPIDYSLNPGKLSEDTVFNVKHLVCFAESLFLIGSKCQLVVAGDQALTPSNFSAPVASSYEVDDNCRPIVNESRMFLANEVGGYTAVREYTVEGSSAVKNGVILSSAVPQLMSGSPLYLSASASEQTLFVRTVGAPNYLFVYKWFDTPKGERVISSWGVWGFGDRVLSHEVVGNTLLLLMQRDEGVTIETLEVPANTKTIESDWPVHLDRKVAVGTATLLTRFTKVYGSGGGAGGASTTDPTDPGDGGGGGGGSPLDPVPGEPPSLEVGLGGISTEIRLPDVSASGSSAMSGSLVGYSSNDDGRDRATSSYDSATDETTITYPWAPTEDTVLVDLSTNRIIASGVGAGSVSGDWTTKPLVAGFSFESRYRFGQAVLPKQSATGGLVALRAPHLQVTRWYVNYNFSGPFDLKVVRENREDVSKTVNPWKVGWSFVSEPIDGRVWAAVLSRADAARVEVLTTSWWPTWFVSADWEGSAHMEAQNV